MYTHTTCTYRYTYDIIMAHTCDMYIHYHSYYAYVDHPLLPGRWHSGDPGGAWTQRWPRPIPCAPLPTETAQGPLGHSLWDIHVTSMAYTTLLLIIQWLLL